MLTLSAGFQKGRVCSRAQTGKPDITERRGGVGEESAAPSLAAPLCRVARTGGGGRVSVLPCAAAARGRGLRRCVAETRGDRVRLGAGRIMPRPHTGEKTENEIALAS